MAFVGLWLLFLGFPRESQAAPDSSCVAARAISELEPDERERLRRMCEASGPSGAALDATDRTTVSAGLYLEGWKAAFVARALATVHPPRAEASKLQRGHERWVTELLARTHRKGKADVPTCGTLRELVTSAIGDLEHGAGAVPPSVRDLAADRDCVTEDEQERLQTLSEGWRLLTIPRRTKDDVEAWVVDLDTLEVLDIQPIPYADDGTEAWLLLLPKDHMVTVSVLQSELDVPWIETRRLVDIDIVLPRRNAECVIIEAGTDAGSDWSVVVDGSPTPLEPVSTRGGGQTQRAILALPREPVDPAGGVPSAHRSSRELVFVSDHDDAAPWVSSLAEERDDDHGRCRSVAYDLTGLYSPQEHIGVAQVSVDQQCRDRGIVPSRVRSYVEGYAERADKTLIPLDTWAEVMEVFRDLESRLGSETSAERGASRGDLDDSQQMIVLASELRRKGIDSLLYFDVRCPKPSRGVTVIGTRVDLDSFVGRAQSKVTGIDTDELLAVRSHDSHSEQLRESMEVVLSDLLVQPHVRFVDPPARVERGVHHKLRAVGVHVDHGLDIGVWALPGTNVAVCDQVQEVNDLSSFDRFETIQTIARRNGKPVLIRGTIESQLDVELGGLEKGTYLAIASMASREGAPQSEVGYAVCFEVGQRDLEIFADISGFRQLTQPRSAPVSTRFSFVRIGGGVRYSAWEYLEFGGRIGYELIEYSTDVVPTFDDLELIDIDSDGRTAVNWQRHGLFAGPFIGVRVPFGRFPWPTCKRGTRDDDECAVIRERRQANPSLATFFLDAHGMVNFGIANIGGVPDAIVDAGVNSAFGADFDLGLTSGIRLRPRRSMTFGVFAGVLVTDIANANTNNAIQHEFWTNDWGVRGLAGFELGFAQPSR